MSHILINEGVNIDVLPQLDELHLARNGAKISVGDLHGNAVKLLYVLARHGMIQISPEDYGNFVNIYRKDVGLLNARDIVEFNKIVSRIQINEAARNSTLNLIGDELADRGMNDYFTLKLYKKLKENNIPVETLISNHGAEFINAYEKAEKFDQSLLGGQALSANNLQKLIDKRLVTREEIIEMVESAYKPTLKLLNYSLNETQERVTIYSHAAIGLNNIRIMAQRLGVEYKGANAKEIAETIEAMNERFTQEYVNQNRISELLDLDKVPQDALNGIIPIDQEKFPFAHLIWNRDAEGLDRPADYTDFVHGHDKRDLTNNNIYNLDNDLGKILSYHDKGFYNILYSNETKLRLSEDVISKIPSKQEVKDFDAIEDIDLQQRAAFNDYQSKLNQYSNGRKVTKDGEPLNGDESDMSRSIYLEPIGRFSPSGYQFVPRDGKPLKGDLSDLSRSVIYEPIKGFTPRFQNTDKNGEPHTGDLNQSFRIIEDYSPIKDEKSADEIVDEFALVENNNYIPGYVGATEPNSWMKQKAADVGSVVGNAASYFNPFSYFR